MLLTSPKVSTPPRATPTSSQSIDDPTRTLRLLVPDCATKIITLLDDTGIIRYQSPPIKWLLGYQAAQCLGRPLTQFLHPGSRNPAGEALRRMVDEGQLFDVWRLRFRNASGNTCWLEGKATNHLDDAELRGILVSWSDLRAIATNAG